MRRRNDPREGQSGKINFVSLLLIAGLIGAGYAGYVYVPLYLQHLDVNHRCREALNSTWRHGTPQRTRDDVLRRVQEIDTVQRDVGGDLRTVPAIEPSRDLEVDIDRSRRPNVLWISMSYDREVPLPLLGRTHVFHFSAYCEREME